VVVGSFNRFHVYTYNIHRNAWEEAGVKTVENLYTVTALGWKPDGSRLSVGALCGRGPCNTTSSHFLNST